MAQRDDATAPAAVVTGLLRACGGALIFGLPMLMTLEMWQLGASMERYRLIALILLAFPLLVGIAHRVGFEATFGWREDFRDAGIALGIAVVTSAGILFLLGILRLDVAPEAAAGQVAVQSLPAAIGALLARSQLGGAAPADGPSEALAGWTGTLFLMLVGAIFLSINVAPTVEMILIAYKMTPWHGLALIALSLLVMHAFVYALAFHGGKGRDDAPGWSRFLRFTLTGYGLCVLISVFMLWAFGRLDGLTVAPAVMATIVLAFPAAIGAAAARLIL